MKKEDIFKQKKHLVGGTVPQLLADKFSLVCLYQKVSRSALIAKFLTAYFAELEKDGIDEKRMISSLAYEIYYYKIWESKQDALPKLLQQANTQLKRRKINLAYRQKILTKVKLLYKDGHKDGTNQKEN